MAAALVLVAGSAAAAGSDKVRYGRAPAWVGPPPAATTTSDSPGAAVRTVYADSQVRLGPGEHEYFTRYRLKVLSAEGLAAGNLTAGWNPDSESFHVHQVEIIRDGRVIDVLADTRFQVVKEENALE